MQKVQPAEFGVFSGVYSWLDLITAFAASNLQQLPSGQPSFGSALGSIAL
jgi:hypothetical protein